VGGALGTVSVGVWMLVGQASAHVEASPASVAAGSTDTITFNVEHGCGDSATVKLEMKLADGVTDAKPAAPALPGLPGTGKMHKLASGLQYDDLVVGSGKMAEPGMNVSLNYRGFLLDGTPFDNSYDRGEPLKFQIAGGQMIQGFDEGVRGMRIGGKRKILVPWQMAYGEAGRPPIPPKADLVFDLELLDVK